MIADNSPLPSEIPESGAQDIPSPKASKKPYRPSTSGIPRLLPWSSGLTQTWAGTKIISAALINSLLLIRPNWYSIAASALLLLSGSLIARVKVNTIPRVPIWTWAGICGGIVGAYLGGDAPIFIEQIMILFMILWSSTLLLWTTPLEEMAPAFLTLLSPLRLLRLPVREWVLTAEMILRSIPLMNDQTRAVTDTVRLRTGGRPPSSFKTAIHLTIDITTASLSASTRRATDTGRAMSIRGGFPVISPSGRHDITWRDCLTLILCIGLTAASVFAPHFIAP